MPYLLGGSKAAPGDAVCSGMLPKTSALFGVCIGHCGQKSSDVCLGSRQAEVTGVMRRRQKPGGHARAAQRHPQAPGATRSHA